MRKQRRAPFDLGVSSDRPSIRRARTSIGFAREAILELMSKEDRRVVAAVEAEAPSSRAALLWRGRFRGGRVFSPERASGRLGTEAAECPNVRDRGIAS
jgi:N-acetylmuramic acid 6-phosphate (MurNAc-6-P) etherase